MCGGFVRPAQCADKIVLQNREEEYGRSDSDHACRQPAASAKASGLSQKRTLGEKLDEAAFEAELKKSVIDVVRLQKEAGVDLINDGELGHTMGWAYDYGSWWSYVVRRLAGVEVVKTGLWMTTLKAHTKTPMAPNDFVVGDWHDRRDMTKFQEAYMDPHSGCGLPEQFMTEHSPLVKGPIKYTGHDAIERDIENFKAGARGGRAETEGAWMNSIAPASCARMPNEYYETDEELLYACADAMREEYKAIIDAGLILQLDDPAIAENWDQIKPEPSVEAYRRYTMLRIEALNHAIRGLPPERIRFHLCWGSWHGPHITDIPMADLVEVMLAVNARLLLLRGGQRPPRARVADLEGRQAAGRQEDPARRRHPFDQRDRAP